MHAISGMVGDPAFQESDVETYEVVLTLRIPKDQIDQDYDGDKSSEIADWVGSQFQFEGIETSVRGRAL